MESLISLSRSEARAEERITGFRQMLRAVLAFEAIFALWLLATSLGKFGLTEIEVAGISPGLTGIMLLWAVLFQVVGYFDPVRNRLPVVIGVLGRYMVGGVALCLGLWIVGIVSLVFGLALNFTYHATVRSIVMARP
ncbi:MAG: hypothetical protein AB8B85_09995 [Paracoccaceae bacterium]